MPIYDDDGTSNYQIGKVYDDDGTSNYQIGKVYDDDGTSNYLIYTAEQAMPNLSTPVVYNYYEYHTTRSGTSTSYWNLSGYSSLYLSWSITTSMSWPNPYGVGSTTTLYLKLSDGKTITIGSKYQTLFRAGDTYSASGSTTISLTGYSSTQLSNVYLYCTLGDMSAASPISGSDRHDANASVTNVIAS